MKYKSIIAIMVLLVLVFTVLPLGTFAADSGYIGAERAKEAALEHAGVTSAQAAFVRANLDYDDGLVVYDVEFYSGTTEYDYEIDALTAEIREFDRDIEYYVIPAGSRTTTDAGRYIGEAAAKDIALAHAKVAASDATFMKAYLDADDGLVVYDVEFYSGNTEYDYEIDALTGNLVEFDRDIEYYAIPRGTPATAPQAPAGAIGEAEAKTIALTHAGATEAQAQFLTVRLDRDDGRTDYDVKFYVGSTEYEYEIDAVSGSIIELDMETKRNAPVPANTIDTGGDIGEARAKSTALSHANVTEAQTSRMRVKLDRDDGRITYEVDFNVGRMEYEYEIDAATGIILESDAEYDD
jgi:uncharacterized membrane protein YkoI